MLSRIRSRVDISTTTIESPFMSSNPSLAIVLSLSINTSFKEKLEDASRGNHNP